MNNIKFAKLQTLNLLHCTARYKYFSVVLHISTNSSRECWTIPGPWGNCLRWLPFKLLEWALTGMFDGICRKSMNRWDTVLVPQRDLCHFHPHGITFSSSTHDAVPPKNRPNVLGKWKHSETFHFQSFVLVGPSLEALQHNLRVNSSSSFVKQTKRGLL